MNKKIKKLVQIALLIAIIVVLSIPPMGSIKLGVFSVTFVFLPVIVGAILLGPITGLILGAAWGIGSFCQALAGFDLGPVLLAASPIGTFIACVIPRAFVGLFAGLIYKALGKRKPLSYGIAALAAPIINTTLFLGCFALLFKSIFMEALFPFLTAIILTNAIPEAIVGLVVGAPLSSALDKAINKS